MKNTLKRIGSFLAIVSILWLLTSYRNSQPGEFMFGEPLGDTGLRYEVYHTKGKWWGIMPGSSYGGSGVVKVFDKENFLVLQTHMGSTAGEVFVFEGELHILPGGSWPLEQLTHHK